MRVSCCSCQSFMPENLAEMQEKRYDVKELEIEAAILLADKNEVRLFFIYFSNDNDNKFHFYIVSILYIALYRVSVMK